LNRTAPRGARCTRCNAFVGIEGCGGADGKWKLKRASSLAYPEYPTEPISRIKRSSSLRGFRNMKPYGASDVCRNVLCVRRDAAPTGVECRGFVAREAFARNGHAKARPYFVECAIV
jgi:hypothetical protein